MDEIDPFGADQFRQLADVQRHAQGVLALRREGDPKAAARLQFADEAAALAGDQRAGAGSHERGGDIDRGALGAAGVQFGDNLEDRSPGKLGKGANRSAWG